MKHFVAIEFAKEKRWVMWFNVYTVENNELQFIESWKYRHWMSKWVESEVQKLLAEKTYISKEYVDEYYQPRIQEEFRIQYIKPFRPI